MKEFLSNVFLFLALALVFSNLTACSNSDSSENVTVGQGPKPTVASTEGDAPKKKSDYPPIATAVAQADIKNLDGSTFKVADKKGKVILLNMWATWCGPCRAEMPALVRMQEKHRDAGLEIIGLNTDDETLDQINGFVQTMKLNYTIAWSDTELQAALLNISKFPGIPQSFLIDRDGNLRGVFKGGGRAEVAKMEELVDTVVTGQTSSDISEAQHDVAPPTDSKEGKESSESDQAPLPNGKEKGKPDGKRKE